MALESGTTIDSLVATNPVASDPIGESDNHHRLIKTVLKTTFAGITGVADEDDMSSDSAAKLATQQSIKAYVDAQVTASDLDFQGDSGGALSIDLDSETLTVAGGTGIDTSGSSNTLTVAIDSTVATLTGSQVLTNKTLTSPVLNTGVSGTAILDEDDLSSDSATQLATQQSIKAYVDSQVTAQDLDLTSDSGTIAIDLDSESLTVAGGTGIDSSATSNTVTLAIDSTVVTLAGSQTLTNKTLTSPVLNTPTIGTSFTIGSATITEAELEVLDGATLTTAELNVLDGITATVSELNILDGVTSTASELNILDGVTATASELNILDGVTSTATELNVMDGDTAASSTTLADADRVVVNDAGTMKQVALTDFETYFETSLDTLSNVTSLGTLTSLTISGDLTVDTNTLKVDSSNNRVGINQASPDVSLDAGSNTDAVHLPTGTTAQRPGSPAAGYFRYNSELSQFEGYTDGWGQIGGGGGGSAPVIDTMTGDNSDTTLALSSAPLNENATFVTFDGVMQHKSTYSVSGSTLTFSTAPPTGVEVECITLVSTSSTTANQLLDADSDTKIQVEESSDEDKIRFDVAGTEEMVMDATGIVINDGSNDRDFRIESNGDTHRLFIDGGNDRLLIGTTASVAMSGVTPSNFLEGTAYASSTLGMAINANGTNESPLLMFGKSRGTSLGSNTIVQNGDRLFSLRVHGSDGTNQEQAALIEAHVDAAPGANEIPGRLSFWTTTDGSQYATEKMRIDNAGNVGIGTASPNIFSFSGATNMFGVQASGTNQWGLATIAGTGTGAAGISLGAGSVRHALVASTNSSGLEFYTNASNSGTSVTKAVAIDSAGHVTMPLQPAFLVNAATQNNISVDTAVTVTFSSEVFDQNADFNTSTYTFTAPVTGRYLLTANVRADNVPTNASYFRVYLVTSNRNVLGRIFDPDAYDSSPVYDYYTVSALVDMDASDTAYVAVYQYEGTAQADLQADSIFSGYLVA